MNKPASGVRLFIWMLLFPMLSGLYAVTAPHLAQRGLDAYKKGNYESAYLYFNRALEKAVLEAREDWKVMAVLNLTDLDMDSERFIKAEKRMEALSRPESHELEALLLWKRSQCAFRLGKSDQAMLLLDSALAVDAGHKEYELAMQQDRLRYRLENDSSQTEQWLYDFEVLQKETSKAKRPGLVELRALYEMQRRDYKSALQFWKKAIDYNRDRRKLLRMASCIREQALCYIALNQLEEANTLVLSSSGIYEQLGLHLPSLKTQALQLFILQDPGALAKLRRDLDLIGQGVNGFNLAIVLSQYQESFPGLSLRQ